MSELGSPLGSTPFHWELVRLKDITTKVGSGATPRGGREVYLDERLNFALIRSQNVYDNYFSDNGIVYISDLHAEQLRNVWLEPEDILLNITGDGATFGRACIVNAEILPACVNQHVMIVRVNREICLPGFLIAYLTHPLMKQYIEDLNVGGSRRAITKGHIESFVVPLPPLPEQRRIAEILGTWNEAIALTERLIDALTHRKRGLMQSLLTGAVRFEGFGEPAKDGVLPSEWTSARLKDVFERINRIVTADIEHVLSITAKVGFQDQREKFSRVIAGKNLERYIHLP